MTAPIGAIDVGSHTARLLIGKIGEDFGIEELRRERKYIRLSESFMDSNRGIIGAEAVERTIQAIKEFAEIAVRYGSACLVVVGTGVIRKARNSAQVVDRIYRETGVRIRIISGEEEAYLSGKGALAGLKMEGQPCLIFDLGGSSTEFFYNSMSSYFVRSVPIGAMELKKSFLDSEPPSLKGLEYLGVYVRSVLEEFLPIKIIKTEGIPLIGTGGTVASLVAVKKKIEPKKLATSQVNGFRLKQSHIREIFDTLKGIPYSERLQIKGLDEGRADIIVAGTATVLEFLSYFKAEVLVASFSDLLEGILIEYHEGVSNG